MKLRKSQRIMSLFLSLLMLLSTFAGSGFTVRAAGGDADEPAIVDEVTGDTTINDDTTADEETPAVDEVTNDGEEAPEIGDTTGSGEEDPEIGDPDAYTDDIQFVFINTGADYAENNATKNGYGTSSHVRLLDGESRDKAVPFYGSNSDVFTSAKKAVKTWDSSQDYVFTVEAATGYIFDSTKYVNQKDKVVKIWATKDGKNNTNSSTGAAPVKVTGMTAATDADAFAVRDAQYKVDFIDSSHAQVTIFKDWMVQFRKDYVAASTAYAAPAIMIEAYATKDTMPVGSTIDGTNAKAGGSQAAADAVEGAQPDTYVVALNENYNAPAVTEVLRTATYGYDMDSIVMTAAGKAISGRPVTGVKIRYYAGTTLTTKASDTDNTNMGWTPASLTLKVPATLVNLGYVSTNSSLNKSHWMEVEFLSSPIKFEQTNTDASDNRKLSFKLDGGSNASGAATGIVSVSTEKEIGLLNHGLLAIYEADKNSGRVLKSISYSINGGTAKTVTTADVTAGAGYAAAEIYKSAYVPVNDLKTAKNGQTVSITGNFGETLTWTPDDKKFIVRIDGTDYNEATDGKTGDADGEADGVITYYADTDKDFTFGVYTPDGKTELSVQYIQGGETFDAVRNADDTDYRRNGTEGLYTIPKAKMNQKTELSIGSDDESNVYHYKVKASVYASTDEGPATVKSSTGAAITDVKIIETKYGQEINGTAADRGTKEQALYFTVIPVSATDNVVKAVYWKEVDAEDSTLKAATLQSTGTGLYMIPAQSADIEIKVVIKKLWLVKAPTNEKVTVTINGKTYKKGNTDARVEDGVGFEYSVKTTDEAAIKITKSGYAVAAASTTNATVTANTWDLIDLVDITGTTEGESSATYQVAAEAVTAPIALYAQTLETRVDGDGYSVDFASTDAAANANGQIDTTTGTVYGVASTPAGNAAWLANRNAKDTAWVGKAAKDDDALVDRIKEDDMYVLLVNQNTSATLTPIIRLASKTTGNGGTVAAHAKIDADKTEYKIGGTSSTLIKVDADSTKKKAVIEAKAQGDDTMAYTVTQATEMTGIAKDKYDENLVSVSGKLKVRVTPHYVLSMTSNRAWADPNYAATGTLKVRNGATLKYAKSWDTSADKAKEWGKSGVAIAWSTSEGVVTVGNPTDDQTTATATVSVTGAQDAAYQLYAYITDTDNEVYTSNKVSIQPLDAKNYQLVPEVQVTGGGRYFGLKAADANTQSNTTMISLGKNDLSSATITVHPYEGAVTNGIAYADVDTETEIETALALPVSDDTKYARDIESGISYTAVAYNHGTTTVSSAVEVTNNNDGSFTVAAKSTYNSGVDVVITASYGGRTFTSVVTFKPCVDTEWIKVDVKDLNDSEQKGVDGKEKVQKFSKDFLADKVLWNSSTDDANIYPPQDGTADYDQATTLDGYQFKIINGAQFVLPGEDDFDQTVYTDKSRMLVGWMVKASAANDIIDEKEVHTTARFHQPGETIAISGGAEVSPVWAYRYGVLAAGVKDNGSLTEQTGFFINNGKTQKINVYSFNTATREIDSVKEEKTNDTLQLGTHASNISGTVTMSDESKAISLESGMQLGATVMEYINAVQNNDKSKLVFNRIYPEAGAGNGKVQWYFFNETISGTANKVVLSSGDGETTFDVPTSEEIKNGGNASSTARDTVVKQILAEANQTVLDKDQLAKGILQGAAAGKAYVYATYTDADGNVYYLLDQPILVEVQEEDAGVNVNIDKVAQQDTASANIKAGIEVGQEVAVAASTIVVRVGTTTLDTTSTAASTGTFKWTVEPAGALEITPSEANTLKGELQPIIKGVAVPEASADGTRAAGEAWVTLTYTAANGVEATSDKISVKVLPASYSIAFTDEKGNALSGDDLFIDAPVNSSSTAKTSNFYMTVKDATGAAITGGTFAFASDDETIVKGASFEAVKGSTWVGTITADNSTGIAHGEATITATYTNNNKSYKITVPFKSYYTVTFGGANMAASVSDSSLSGIDYSDAKYMNITNAAGTVISDEKTHIYIKKIYKSDLNYKDGKGYEISLSDIRAKYIGTGSEGVNFLGWNTTGTAKADQVLDSIKVNPAADQLMYAIFGDTAAETLTTSKSTIRISNAGEKSTAGNYVPNTENLTINMGPVTSGDVIKIKSDNAGFLDIKEGELKMSGDAVDTVYAYKGEFKTDATYAVNDVVYYATDSKYYKFKSAHSTGAWAAGEVDAFDPTAANLSKDFTALSTTIPMLSISDKSTAKQTAKDNDANKKYKLTLITKLSDKDISKNETQAMAGIADSQYTAGKATLTIYTAGNPELTREVTVIVYGLYTKDGKLHYMQESGEDITNGSVTIGKKTYYFDEEGGQVTDGIAYNENGQMVVIIDGEPQQGYVENGDKKGHNFYTDENGIVQTGRIVAEDGSVYYGDPENGWLITDTFVTTDGVLNYFGGDGRLVTGDGKTFKTITSEKESVNKGVFDYMIDENGAITTAALITVDEAGNQVYVDSYGRKVTVDMVKDTNGKYTDPVTELVYVIDENGYATADTTYYFDGYEIAEDWKWNDGAPSVKVTMKYVSEDGKDTSKTETLTLLATTTDGDDVTYKTWTATTTAKFVRKGETEKEVVTLTKKYDKDGKSGVYTVRSYEIKWADAIAEGSTLPNVTATVIYTVTEEDGTTTEETQNPVALVAQNTEKSTDSVKVFTASITVVAGSNGEGGDTITAEASYTVDGKLITHEDHVWSKPVFDWTGTTSQSGIAKAVFTCTADENAPHSVEVAAAVTEKSRKEASGKDKSKVVYTATVTGPDGKEYSENATITYTVDDDGKVIDEEPVQPGKGGSGIAVEFVDEDVDTDENGLPVYVYTGAAIKPAVRVLDQDRDVQLALSSDYTLKYSNNKNAGTATITVNGKGNYVGKTVSAQFKIISVADKAAADNVELVDGVKKVAKITGEYVYTGAAQYPETLSLTLSDKSTLSLKHDGEGAYSVDGEADKTVVVSVTNNVNKGTATVAVAGKDGKVKKASFKIKAAPLPTGDDVYEASDAVFAVKGAVPASITGEFGDSEIVLGQDFTAKYSGNKAVGTATATLKGKGNFTGSATVNYNVEALDLDDAVVAVAAVPGKKISAGSVTVVDGNGVKVPAKQLKVSSSNSDKLSAGSEITVTVSGDGTNITGEREIELTVGSNKKAKAAVAKGFTVPYTGEPVTLDEDQQKNITVTIGKATLDPEKYEVVGYLNNRKKGSMTVIIQGNSEDFTGVVTCKVKIVAKTMEKAD